MQSDSLDQLIPALVKARTGFLKVTKDGYNPHFKSRFATLQAMQEATEHSLNSNGLVVAQFPSFGPQSHPTLTTYLMHSSGQWISETSPLSMVKQDPQAQGSAITYMRRYAYGAVLGLVSEEDDDGNAATLDSKPPRGSMQGDAGPMKDNAARATGDNSAGVEALRQACEKKKKDKEKVAKDFWVKFGVPPKDANNETLKAFAALIEAGTYS